MLTASQKALLDKLNTVLATIDEDTLEQINIKITGTELAVLLRDIIAPRLDPVPVIAEIPVGAIDTRAMSDVELFLHKVRTGMLGGGLFVAEAPPGLYENIHTVAKVVATRGTEIAPPVFPAEAGVADPINYRITMTDAEDTAWSIWFKPSSDVLPDLTLAVRPAYHYTNCDIPDIWLLTSVFDTPPEEVAEKEGQYLHLLIIHAIVNDLSEVSHDEIRFLSKHLNLSEMTQVLFDEMLSKTGDVVRQPYLGWVYTAVETSLGITPTTPKKIQAVVVEKHSVPRYLTIVKGA